MTVGLVQLEEPTTVSRGTAEQFWRRFRRDKVGIAAAIYLTVLIFMAFLGAPIVASMTGHDPETQYAGGIDLNGLALPSLSR